MTSRSDPRGARLLGQIDGLEDGRVIRNAVEKLDLVEGHPQDVPNDRRERLGVPPGLLADRGVEPRPVPHDAVDKLEGEAPVGLPRESIPARSTAASMEKSSRPIRPSASRATARGVVRPPAAAPGDTLA